MTDSQRDNAELLKALGRPADAIAANSSVPVKVVKAWLKSDKWPESAQMQQKLFDATGFVTRPKATKPSVPEERRGLHLFSNPRGKPEFTQATPSGITQ